MTCVLRFKSMFKIADSIYKINICKAGYTMNVKTLKAGTEVIVYKDKKANA